MPVNRPATHSSPMTPHSSGGRSAGSERRGRFNSTGWEAGRLLNHRPRPAGRRIDDG